VEEKEIRKTVVDSGNEGKYRVVVDLDWCEEHHSFESTLIKKYIKHRETNGRSGGS
jgi:hypothetical protein